MLLSLIATLALSAAKPTTDPCRDDDGKNRCLPAEQEKMRTLYRVAPIETYANAQVRRLFFVDGYGNDIVALEFVRAAGSGPMVRVHFRHIDGLADLKPLEEELTLSQWNDVLALSRDFEKSFAGPAKASENGKGKGSDEAMTICLHSSVYWGEAIDPGAKKRSVVDDACNDPPIETFAWQAAKMAVAAFPHCDLLDRSLARNDASLLANCSGLAGDRLAAARVFNEAKGFRFLDDKQGGKLAELAGYQIKLDLQGAAYAGKEAEGAWDKIFADGNTYYYWDEARGIDSETVQVVGGIIRRGKAEDGSDDQRADVSMTWEEDGGQFEIESITAGVFFPYRKSSP